MFIKTDFRILRMTGVFSVIPDVYRMRRGGGGGGSAQYSSTPKIPSTHRVKVILLSGLLNIASSFWSMAAYKKMLVTKNYNFPVSLLQFKIRLCTPRGIHKHFFDRDASPRTNFNYPKKIE